MKTTTKVVFMVLLAGFRLQFTRAAESEHSHWNGQGARQ
jgi:hypothetical protein